MQTPYNIELTDKYKGLSYRDNLSDHILSVLDVAGENEQNYELKSKDLVFSKRLYNECVITIHDDYKDQVNLSNSEDYKAIKKALYVILVNQLGSNFKINDNVLLQALDFTVNNCIDYIKFKDVLVNNPWAFSNNILLDNNLLYSFTDNIDEYRHLLKKNQKESEVTKQLTIGIIAKGNRPDYTQTYIKDIYALRNVLLQFLDSNDHDCRNPLKIKDIIGEFRRFGVLETDVNDNKIKSWIVSPLKKFAKLGSNKNGFFIIRNEEDLYESYSSHFSNYTGFYRTLERHKNFASNLNFSTFDFDKHNQFSSNPTEPTDEHI